MQAKILSEWEPDRSLVLQKLALRPALQIYTQRDALNSKALTPAKHGCHKDVIENV